MNVKTEKILATISPEQWAAIAEYANKRAIATKSIPMTDNSRTPRSKEDLYVKVTDIMKEIGFSANIKGYNYFRAAVVLAYEDESYVENITTKLYPEIAKDFDTTPSKVERAIRYSIERVCFCGDVDAVEKYFTYSSASGKPTNSEAIACLVDYLKLH